MSIVELHPDELLDREARGDLTDAESARLDDHLAGCAVCRFERQARSDFRAEFETVARRAKAARAPDAAERRARVDGRRKWRVRAGLLLAAALLVASAAAADWSSILRGASDAPGAPSAPAPVGEVAPPTATHGSAPTQTVATVVAPLESAAAEPSAEPVAPDPSSARPTAAPNAPRALAPTPDTTATTATTIATPDPSSAPASAEPQIASTPAMLFAQASDLRKRGAYDDAIRAYRDLARQHAGSTEATTAHAILGRLLLDRGDAAGALAEYDQYLRAGIGALREEALAGRATALQRLGLPKDEAAAWHALLDAYPRTVHAARARARLDALETK